ncbi:MAG TPA: hypothetical protein VL088_00915 [Pedobacter sp.]|nr:hypothetical protein [Pedobacter sp.]
MLNRFLGLMMLFLCVSCAKEDYLPNLPVNFSAPITDPRLNRISSAGGSVIIDGYGIAGLIICRRADNSYAAFDRCSTVNPEEKNAVIIETGGLTALDEKSGAKFNLIDGGPAKAPAKKALKQYSVTISGYTLRVTN